MHKRTSSEATNFDLQRDNSTTNEINIQSKRSLVTDGENHVITSLADTSDRSGVTFHTSCKEDDHELENPSEEGCQGDISARNWCADMDGYVTDSEGSSGEICLDWCEFHSKNNSLILMIRHFNRCKLLWLLKKRATNFCNFSRNL